MADRARRRSVAGYSLHERISEDSLRTTYRASIADRQEHFHVFRGLAEPEEQGARYGELFRALSIPPHPAIVRVTSIGREGNTVYATTEPVAGRSLKEWIQRERASGLPLDACLWIAEAALSALEHLHGLPAREGGPAPDGVKGAMVLRTMDPSVFWVSPEGSIKLDLVPGLSAFQPAKELHEKSTAPVGFESPEQILGEALDPRSDLFSLGATLASLLLGHKVLVGPNTFETYQRIIHANAHVPKLLSALRPKLQTTLGRALRQERDARFQSAAEFSAAMRNVATVLGIEPSPRALSLAVMAG